MAEPIYSVSEITGAVKRTLESGYSRVLVRGEISNLRRPSSGHYYFALKDDRAQIRSVLFRGDALGLRFIPADGLEVEAEGEITVYEPRGDLQLLVRRLRPSGVGALMQAFEALKKRLAAEGLFEPGRKKALPAFPRVIGIITSPTGAAVRDLIHVIRRRWPVAEIVFHPVSVQGEGAARRIAAAVERMDRWGKLDVLVVGRGGGSLEDLWAFNEEPVARALAACRVPVVSAVGHETDVTIADMVADVRAATPSAAAEIITPSRDAVAARLRTLEHKLSRRVQEVLEIRRRHLLGLVRAYGFRRPDLFLRREEQRVDDLRDRLQQSLERRLVEERHRTQEWSERLSRYHPRDRLRASRLEARALRDRLVRGMGTRLSEERGRVGSVERALRALNPAGVLNRGFCLVRDGDSLKVITAAEGTEAGAPVLLQFARDRLRARVEESETGGPMSPVSRERGTRHVQEETGAEEN